MNRSYCLVHNAIHEGYTILTSVTSSFIDPQLWPTPAAWSTRAVPVGRHEDCDRECATWITVAPWHGVLSLGWKLSPTPYSHAALSALPTMHSFTWPAWHIRLLHEWQWPLFKRSHSSLVHCCRLTSLHTHSTSPAEMLGRDARSRMDCTAPDDVRKFITRDHVVLDGCAEPCRWCTYVASR